MSTIEYACDQITVDEVIKEYIELRDQLEVMEKRHKAEKKEIQDTQNLLEEWIMRFLDQTGSSAIKTDHGTCYSSMKFSATLADSDAFLNFVKETNKWELLDRRANTTAVRDYVEQEKMLPPGCNLNSSRRIGVRRA